MAKLGFRCPSDAISTSNVDAGAVASTTHDAVPQGPTIFGYVEGPAQGPNAVDVECAKRTPGFARTPSLLADTASSATPSPYGFYAIDGTPPEPRKNTETPIQITIDGPATRRINEHLDIHVTFKNTGAAPVVVAQPLDGSLEHWRYPTYDLYIRSDADSLVRRFDYRGSRCGNVNSISDRDFVTLAPGESRKDIVTGWAHHIAQAWLPVVGRYTVWVVYSYCGYKAGAVPLGYDVRKMDVQIGVYASNALTVVVSP